MSIDNWDAYRKPPIDTASTPNNDTPTDAARLDELERLQRAVFEDSGSYELTQSEFGWLIALARKALEG